MTHQQYSQHSQHPHHIHRVSDLALLVRFDSSVNYAHISQLAAACRQNIADVVEAVPAYNQILIEWNTSTTYSAITQKLTATFSKALTHSQTDSTANSEPLVVPVCYHPSLAPDLEHVATTLGLTEQEVIRQHLSTNYQIDAIGFMPGFAYLGGLPDTLRMPRRATPRTQVPAGSVAIAENNTAVYPLAAPGGWNLIGRSPTPLGDPHTLVSTYNQPENLALRVGKQVTFKEITLEEYQALTPPETAPQALTTTASDESLVSSLVSALVADIAVGQMTVLQTGPLALIQDGGRKQVQHLGVSQCGSADRYAQQWANKLLGNEPSAPVVEITLGLFKARFDAPATIAITGADCHATLNNRPLHNWASHRVNAGDTLAFGGARNGARAYLAIASGFACATLFGSSGMNPKEQWPHMTSQLTANQQVLFTRDIKQLSLKMAPWYKQPEYGQTLELRVYPSYQYEQFDTHAKTQLCNSTYQVHPHSDRMGYRLEGCTINWQHGGITSEPIAFGSVQIPPSGQPIVLLNDRQTLGGYPKIGCVKAEDCWQLAQRQAGQEVRFRFIEWD